MKSQILIGCGSNLKNPLFQLSKAMQLLSAKHYITLYAASPIYISEPLGYKKQADFFNCVVAIKTRLKAHSLLNNNSKIETLTENAFNFVVENYSWKNLLPKYQTFYENLLK